MNDFLKKRLDAAFYLADEIMNQGGRTTYANYSAWRELISGINTYVIPVGETKPNTAKALRNVVTTMKAVLPEIQNAKEKKKAVTASKLRNVQGTILAALRAKDAHAIRAADAAANRMHRALYGRN